METVKARRLEAIPIDQVQCVRGEKEIAEAHAAFLADESRLSGRAEWLFLPGSPEQVAAVVSWAQENKVVLTISGGRTGITGGAVPEGGAILSLERMKKVLGAKDDGAGPAIEVEPGLTVDELAALLKEGHDCLPGGVFFYPPDPTETTAQIGGTIACNASGARTFRYGPTRRWIKAVDVVLPGADIITVERGGAKFDEAGRIAIETSQGMVQLELPERPLPDVRKDVAGYYMRPGMDLLDLLIGSEGTLGIVTRAVLRLEEAPAGRVSVMLFPEEEKQALKAVAMLREGIGGVESESIEFFDRNSLALLENKRREGGPGGEIPPFPYPAGAAVFGEFPFQDETQIDDYFEAILGLVESVGLDEDRTWVATDEDELERMKAFRHALPETINSIIGQRKGRHADIRKVGTDLAVPVSRLEEFVAFHHELLGASGLEYVVFGHYGDGHVHSNMLPRDDGEMSKALELYEALAGRSVELGGTVAAEHGIGRIKKKYLPIMLPQAVISGMWKIKHAVDPAGILSPGVLF